MADGEDMRERAEGAGAGGPPPSSGDPHPPSPVRRCATLLWAPWRHTAASAVVWMAISLAPLPTGWGVLVLVVGFAATQIGLATLRLRGGGWAAEWLVSRPGFHAACAAEATHAERAAAPQIGPKDWAQELDEVAAASLDQGVAMALADAAELWRALRRADPAGIALSDLSSQHLPRFLVLARALPSAEAVPAAAPVGASAHERAREAVLALPELLRARLSGLSARDR